MGPRTRCRLGHAIGACDEISIRDEQFRVGNGILRATTESSRRCLTIRSSEEVEHLACRPLEVSSVLMALASSWQTGQALIARQSAPAQQSRTHQRRPAQAAVLLDRIAQRVENPILKQAIKVNNPCRSLVHQSCQDRTRVTRVAVLTGTCGILGRCDRWGTGADSD